MEAVEEILKKALCAISCDQPEALSSIMTVIRNCGVETTDDLEYLTEGDLASVLKTIQARKLLQCLKMDSKLDQDKSVISQSTATGNPGPTATTGEVLDIQAASDVGSENGKAWPLLYELPFIPASLSKELENAKSVMSLSRTAYHGIVRILYEDLLQYTLYPSSQQFASVCTALIRRYPAMQDRVVFKDSNSAAKHVADLTAVAGEDAVSIEKHVQTMQVEFAKPTPNEMLIHDRMMRTLSERRQDVTEMKLNELLEKYPALTLDCELIAEVKRMKSIDITEKLTNFFSKERVLVILDSLRGKKGTAEMLGIIGKATNMDLFSQQRQCALILLPVLFGEPYDDWFSFNKDPKLPSPTVVVRAEATDSIFIADNISTILDGVTVSQPRDLFQAFCSMLAMYWVFDVAYARRLRKTFSFLSSYICKLESCKVNAAMQRRLNVLYSL